MKDELRISLIQTELHWESPEANLEMFTRKLASLKDTDFIILPEMFSTGFTMNATPNAEEPNGPAFRWMRETASAKNAAVTGSVIVTEEGRYYNRLYFVFPDGKFHQYDKRHTFTLAGEHEVYEVGTSKLVIEYLGWRICPLICYDLRFPVWARNVEDYHLLLYVANWPKKRVAGWDALLRARAIENMSYCVGVNRVGLDGNGFEYTGHSAVYDVLGEALTPLNSEEDLVLHAKLSKIELEKHRNHLQFLNDRDSFTLH